MAAQPFGPNDAKAAIIDDARRVGAVQRLATATVTLGVLASSGVARLLLASDLSLPGTFAVVILLAFWFAVPGTTDTLHRRWVLLVSHPRRSAA